jgi:murein DD-endopeptidase MepM/ murein hydrolase activator NlpD
MFILISELSSTDKSLLTGQPVKMTYYSTPPKVIATLLISAVSLFSFFSQAHADIYRFVTVDGVETFTDAPVNKEARLVVKETAKKNKKNNKKEKVHTISLDEIVAKTVQSSLNPQENKNSTSFEPHLPPVGGVITSGVGVRIDPIDGKLRHHNGIDIAISTGTQVTPVAPGVVVYSGQRSGYGNTVLIEHENGVVTLYGHNSRLMVSSGQPVDENTVIALSGSTGRSTGPHLHFEAWQAGVNITPAFMPGNSKQLPRLQLASGKQKTHFHKEIMADGSVLFTNIPSSTH